ncbi:MAG: hypothetical protein KatS3mg129_2161 [Leptospiraceae bacterium]|nr:MAG: hypothetical protein KatS3mg129_2161 [Leptospiraceae bacterium]
MIQSNFKGNFNGNQISFLWQNSFSDSPDYKKIAYLRLSKLEYKTDFDTISGNSILLHPQFQSIFFNKTLLSNYNSLYKKNGLRTIKENSMFFEFGIKIQQNL